MERGIYFIYLVVVRLPDIDRNVELSGCLNCNGTIDETIT